ncbi:toll/interleukin-1 receptor domain-containing protein [Sphingobacterium hungaricum]
MKAFISYSHKDENYLERLKVHLAQMKRDGLIEEWTDKEIQAGKSLDNEISDSLASSELFLAVLSPDYIASNYCYEKEFQTAQKMQKEGKITIVPIIVEACDWKKTPFGDLKALPKDGKAVSEWANANIAFLNVIDELRHLSQSIPSLPSEFLAQSSSVNKPVRNYKVKKYFSAVDKFKFKEASFADIKKYFKSSIEELQFVENLQAQITNEDKRNFTCLISNRANLQNAHITIQIGNEAESHFGDLNYSFTDQVRSNSVHMDKIFNIDNDDYDQFWTIADRIGFGYSRQNEDKPLSANEVAELIWNDFIRQVGVS